MSTTNGNGKVSGDQRFSAANPCPICGGHPGKRRGQGERCTGFRTADGKSVLCERAQSDDPVDTATGILYRHLIADGSGHQPNGRSKKKPPGHRIPQLAAKSYAAYRKRNGEDLGSLTDQHWTYTSRSGRPILAVFRFDSTDPDTGALAKHYLPVHRDTEDDLWRTGDPPGRLPLYHLDELAEADLVVITEGEKAADAVRDLGMVTTTSSHGAKQAHRSDWSPLAGKDVVILPDNDADGRRYRDDVFGQLAKLDPPSTVRVLDLDVPPKGDAFDWVQSGGTAEYLNDLIEAADVVEPPLPLVASNGKPPTVEAGQAVADDDLARHPRTEFGLAERFHTRFGNTVRYCHPWGKFFVWDGRRWKLDDKARARQLGKRVVRRLYAEANAIGDDDERRKFLRWALQCESKKSLDAMLALVTHEDGIPVVPDDMDQDPWILNVHNGTINLRTGQLRAHEPGDLLTKLSPIAYQPDAKCPTFNTFLGRIFDGRDDLVRFVQSLCGYLLTGTVSEQILPILHGVGANGKSTLVTSLLDLLGPDYAMKAPADFIMARRSEAHPTELADLFGKRLVVASETGEGARLNESLVKELTGSERIRARRMRQDFWEFDPTHKVLLCTNHKPAIRGTDHAIWRRIRLVPFSVVIPDEQQDKRLVSKLRDELPGILAWCVRGCLDWQRDGLRAPAEVLEATSQYRSEEDVLQAFLEEHCLIAPSLKAKSSDLYARYKAWGEASGEFVHGQHRFGKALTERGLERYQNNGTWYRGIGLRSKDEDLF